MSLTESLDEPCHSPRDFLAVVHGVRQERRRGDVLRMLEDALLDLVGDETSPHSGH